MNMSGKKIWFVICFFMITVQLFSSDFLKVNSGRYVSDKFKASDESPFIFSFNYGKLSTLDGKVEETKRASRSFDEKRGEYEKYLEDYSLDELGFKDNYSLIGFQLEKRFKFVTFLLDFSHFNFDAKSTAADEPYAIGVKEIEYNGQEYEYMLIPQGQSFTTEINGGIIELDAIFTPFHFSFADSLHFSPWFVLGLYSIGGEFDIDAGEPQGITNYEYHPYDYVVGGQGEGWFGAGFPNLGFGGEFNYNIKMKNNDFMNLVFQFKIIDISWDGSTDDLGVNVRNEKDIDLEYTNNEYRFYVELPVFEKVDFLIGLKYQKMDAFVIAEAKERVEDEIEALKEKYDKNIEVNVEVMSLIFSFRY